MGNIFAGDRRPSQPTIPTPTTVQNHSEPSPAPVVGVPVAHEAIAVATPGPTSTISLSSTVDKPAVGFSEGSSVTAMLSLKAPSESAKSDRASLDIVACIDRSGSMQGQKMDLMKKTLELLVTRSGLTANDRFSIVTFDTHVKTDMRLTAMDSEGRSNAQRTISSLRAGSTTNLSGGALKAIDILATNPSPDGHRTRAVLLFTDGLANAGISEPVQLVQAVSSALQSAAAASGALSLFTFGFGDNHAEGVLRDISASHGSGGYYYVNTVESIPDAFADCLGGLTSVVAHNATLSLTPVGGAVIQRVLGNTYSRSQDGSIELGDLYADDEKDILIELQLPLLSAPREEASAILQGSLRAFNVARSAMETVETTVHVARPTEAPATQPVNLALDLQRNRIAAAEAMEAASRSADHGDVAAGRARLLSVREHILQSASADTPTSSALMDELGVLESNYTSVSAYRNVGSKMSKMAAHSHSRQRASHMTSEGMYAAAASKKKLMKKSWMSSIAASTADSDSD